MKDDVAVGLVKLVGELADLAALVWGGQGSNGAHRMVAQTLRTSAAEMHIVQGVHGPELSAWERAAVGAALGEVALVLGELRRGIDGGGEGAGAGGEAGGAGYRTDRDCGRAGGGSDAPGGRNGRARCVVSGVVPGGGRGVGLGSGAGCERQRQKWP